MDYTTALLVVAEQHGLSVTEAERALKWGRIDKSAKILREMARRPKPAPEPSFELPRSTHVWCEQCETLVRHEAVSKCASQWCKAKEAA